MHLNFLDTSPLKVFASGTRCIPEVYPVNLRYTWSTKAIKRFSGTQVYQVYASKRGIPEDRISKSSA